MIGTQALKYGHGGNVAASHHSPPRLFAPHGVVPHCQWGPVASVLQWLGLPDSPELRARLDRLVPFAQATGSGSFYALWRCDDCADLATLPVILFGDEGDLDVVASGLRELLRLLAIDHEWYLSQEERDVDEEHSPAHGEYLVWLEERFGLSALYYFLTGGQ
ncbi:hypothetical protein [Streptomyces sp. NPDC055099]